MPRRRSQRHLGKLSPSAKHAESAEFNASDGRSVPTDEKASPARTYSPRKKTRASSVEGEPEVPPTSSHSTGGVEPPSTSSCSLQQRTAPASERRVATHRPALSRTASDSAGFSTPQQQHLSSRLSHSQHQQSHSTWSPWQTIKRLFTINKDGRATNSSAPVTPSHDLDSATPRKRRKVSEEEVDPSFITSSPASGFGVRKRKQFKIPKLPSARTSQDLSEEVQPTLRSSSSFSGLLSLGDTLEAASAKAQTTRGKRKRGSGEEDLGYESLSGDESDSASVEHAASSREPSHLSTPSFDGSDSLATLQPPPPQQPPPAPTPASTTSTTPASSHSSLLSSHPPPTPSSSSGGLFSSLFSPVYRLFGRDSPTLSSNGTTKLTDLEPSADQVQCVSKLSPFPPVYLDHEPVPSLQLPPPASGAHSEHLEVSPFMSSLTTSEELELCNAEDLARLIRAQELEDEEEDEEWEWEEADPYVFIGTLPPLDPAVWNRPPLLPPKLATDPPVTLVLDLDETLVHSTTTPMREYDHTFSMVVHDINYQVWAKERPHVHHFLSEVAKMFEVVIFTASQELYAAKLLSLVDTKHVIRHHLYRDACQRLSDNYLKELSVLGRDLSKVIIVDNNPAAFGFQVDNGIPIVSWFDDSSDQCLLELLPFLRLLSTSEDVRPHIREKYKLRELIERSRKM